MEVPKVYQAICNVIGALSREGISKDRKNVQQGYQFRGIDDVYNALASELSKNKLCVLPCVLDRNVVEKPSKSGGVLFYTTCMVRFDFVSAEDGSKHEIVTVGEAMDSGDKGSNKAMSAAYKYAALMAFCIPTEGDNDTENQTHEVAPQKQGKPAPAPKAASKPAPSGASHLADAVASFAGIKSLIHLGNHWKAHYQEYSQDPQFKAITEAKDKRKAELSEQPPDETITCPYTQQEVSTGHCGSECKDRPDCKAYKTDV